MLKFLEMNWFPIICASIIAAIFILFIISRIDLYRIATRKGVGAEIEKSQDVLSRDALQRRVVDYQNKVTKLQRDLTERAQSIEMSYQKALNEIQTKHLDPIIEGVIAKKKLSLVIDGRMARMGADTEGLDITDEVIKALDKKVSKTKMETPKGF